MVENREVLLALAEHAEAASGSDRGLDADIELAIGNWSPEHHEAWWNYECAGESANPPMHAPTPPRWFSTSLDAAMTLATGTVLLHLSDIGADGLPLCSLGDPTTGKPGEWIGIAASLPLSVCAAALRAHAARLTQSTEDHRG